MKARVEILQEEDTLRLMISFQETYIGLGIDTEEVGRFRGLDRTKDRAFLRKIFTPSELTYCFSKRDPAPHLAARFCAKEAVTKALSDMGVSHGPYVDIEILKLARGTPRVRFAREQVGIQITVSLTHTKETALATALAMRTRKKP